MTAHKCPDCEKVCKSAPALNFHRIHKHPHGGAPAPASAKPKGEAVASTSQGRRKGTPAGSPPPEPPAKRDWRDALP